MALQGPHHAAYASTTGMTTAVDMGVIMASCLGVQRHTKFIIVLNTKHSKEHTYQSFLIEKLFPLVLGFHFSLEEQ